MAGQQSSTGKLLRRQRQDLVRRDRELRKFDLEDRAADSLDPASKQVDRGLEIEYAGQEQSRLGNKGRNT